MSKLSRGWLVVVGLFIILTTSAGLGFYGLSVYLSALNRTRGFSVSGMSAATAVDFIASGVAGVFIARLLRTIDPRPIVIAGALIASGAMLLLGRVTRSGEVRSGIRRLAAPSGNNHLGRINPPGTQWRFLRRRHRFSRFHRDHVRFSLRVGGSGWLPFSRAKEQNV